MASHSGSEPVAVVERLCDAMNAHDIELDMAGVIVCGLREGRLAWARLYVEPVDHADGGIDAAVRRMTGD